MGRERVRRNLQKTRQIAGCKTIRFVPDQCPERFQPGGLRKRSERRNSFFYFHKSRFMEILASCQLDRTHLAYQYFENTRNIV